MRCLIKHTVQQNGQCNKMVIRKYREMAILAGNSGTSHERAKSEIMRATNFADIISLIDAQGGHCVRLTSHLILT